jgi:hypothetical protein
MLAAAWRRVLLSAAITALLLYLATEAMFVSTAPKLVSLVVEPFSLLLMPGLVVAIVLAGPHDFTPGSVLFIAAMFYFAFFYWALTWLSKPARFTLPGSR